MFRKRQGKKEKNVWKQYIQPTEDASLPKLFLLTDQGTEKNITRKVKTSGEFELFITITGTLEP